MADAVDRLLARARARRSQAADPALGRLVRVRAGLSQEELAALVGVGRSAVSRWETGERTPRSEALLRYRALLERLAGEGSHAA